MLYYQATTKVCAHVEHRVTPLRETAGSATSHFVGDELRVSRYVVAHIIGWIAEREAQRMEAECENRRAGKIA